MTTTPAPWRTSRPLSGSDVDAGPRAPGTASPRQAQTAATSGRASQARTSSERRPEVRVGSSGGLIVTRAKRSPAAGPSQWLGLLAIATTALAADQALKQIVSRTLALGDEVSATSVFGLTHIRNSGIAFGLFGSWTSIVTLLPALALLAMLGYFAHAGGGHPILPVALGLLVGGAASNFADRFRLGYVTDYLEVPRWPNFNLADTFIVAGVMLLAGTVLVLRRR